jgi:hypothetical protein
LARISPAERKTLMNITTLLTSVNYQDINNKNSQKFLSAASSLPLDTVGKNGSILDDVAHFAHRLRRCGTSATIAHTDNGTEVREAHRCGAGKICPVCADTAAGERLRGLRDALKTVNQDKIKYAYFVTATIKTGRDIYDQLDALRTAWRAWYRLGRAAGRSRGEARKITGYIKSVEIGLSTNDAAKYHNHIHAVIFTDRPLDYKIYDDEIKKNIVSQMQKDGFNGKSDARSRAEFKRRIIDAGGVSATVVYNGEEKPVSKITAEWFNITGSIGFQVLPIWGHNLKNKAPEKFDNFLQNTGIRAAVIDEMERAGMVEDTPENRAEYKRRLERAGAPSAVLNRVKYMLKYSVKCGDIDRMNDEQIFNLYDVMRGARLRDVGGFLRKKHEEKELEEQAEEERPRMLSDEEARALQGNDDIEILITGKTGEPSGIVGDAVAHMIHNAAHGRAFKKYLSDNLLDVQVYRAARRHCVEYWRAGLINNMEYIGFINDTRARLKTKCHENRLNLYKYVDEIYTGQLFPVLVERGLVAIDEPKFKRVIDETIF